MKINRKLFILNKNILNKQIKKIVVLIKKTLILTNKFKETQ